MFERSKDETALLLGICVLFFVGGIWMVETSDTFHKPTKAYLSGWFAALVFGWFGIKEIINLIRFPKKLCCISDTGITVFPKSLTEIPWADIASISTKTVGLNSYVVLNFSPEASARRKFWAGRNQLKFRATLLKPNFDQVYRAVFNAHSAYQSTAKTTNVHNQGDS
ncbi:STM3941 family protein [Ruegeria faecimaris]|uniref:STM3941 family protein n=1 Tax=Ruegeria faecimaris TaxID=686389 RepID=UPI002492C1E9|nr:STM3941 family protein [Ruegeria faecimaris]